MLMPALDHFVVAAIDVDPTNEKGGTRSDEWARVAAVLRAFVVGDDAALGGVRRDGGRRGRAPQGRRRAGVRAAHARLGS